MKKIPRTRLPDGYLNTLQRELKAGMSKTASRCYGEQFEQRMKKLRTQQREEIAQAIRDIGLALSVTHNTVATDVPTAKPVKDQSWRVNHKKELRQLKQLKARLSTDTCPLCKCRNRHP